MDESGINREMDKAVSAIILRPVHVESPLNFLIAVAIALPLAWTLSSFVRKIPYT